MAEAGFAPCEWGCGTVMEMCTGGRHRWQSVATVPVMHQCAEDMAVMVRKRLLCMLNSEAAIVCLVSWWCQVA